MSDEPTPGAGGGDQAGSTDDTGRDAGASSPPPEGDAYRWHGPSPHAYPGAEGYSPYGQPPGPYQAYGPYRTPNAPYGPPPGAYGTRHSPPYSWPYVPPPPPRPPLSPEERRRRNRRALAMGGVLVLAVGAGIGIGAAVAPTSPAAVAGGLVSHAIDAATSARTYHYIDESTDSGAPYDIVGDAAPDGGQQLITQRCRAVGGTATTATTTSKFELRLVDGVVYFRGNRVAVVDELGVPASHARTVIDKWVKVLKNDRPYHTFEEGITTSSNISQLRSAIIPTSSRKDPQAAGSTEVLGSALKTPKSHTPFGTAVLVLNTASGRPSSLRGSAQTSEGTYQLSWTFNHYGEKVHAGVPSTSTSFASLHTKTPTKGTCV